MISTIVSLRRSTGVDNNGPQLSRLDRVIENFGLTRRQTAIMRMLSLGYTSEQIADELQISGNTVRTHLRNMFTQLNVTDRAKLVALVLAHVIMDLEKEDGQPV